MTLFDREAQVHRRVARNSPKSAEVSRLTVSALEQSGVRLVRRSRAALVVGAGLAALGFLTFGSVVAGAGRSGSGESPVSFVTGQSAGSGDQLDGPGLSQRQRGGSGGAGPQSLSSRAVCVRLCDGSFFPVNGEDAHRSQAACASQCPGAPTQVFYRAIGSDQIEDAIASNGQRYAALPVAFRYRSTVDNTCTCGARSARESSVALLHDPTLRKGDSIMTAAGVRVFRGAHKPPYDMDDFIDLAQSSLPREARDTLMAMDRVNARSPGTSAGGATPESPAAGSAGIQALRSVAVSSFPAN
jgi:hypothetical protein